MGKRVMFWLIPLFSFVASATLSRYSGPSWAVLAARTLFQSSSTGTVGNWVAAPDSGVIMDDGPKPGGNELRALRHRPVYWRPKKGDLKERLRLLPVPQQDLEGGPHPFTGEFEFSTTDLFEYGFDGMKESRHFVSLRQYEDGQFGPSWRHGVPMIVDMGNNKFHLVIGSRHTTSWTKSGSTFTPDFYYKETLLQSQDASALLYRDEDGKPSPK